MSAPALIPVEEAAKRLGISPDTLRAHLRAGAWQCIGASATQNPGARTWHYLIPRAGFERLMDGTVPQTIEVHIHKHVDPEAIGKAVLTAVSAA